MSRSADSAGAAPAAKRQGPIRFEAVVPLAIVLLALGLYCSLFFDVHLRRGLEYGATLANGAEVNIGRLKTSFFNASVTVENIGFTDPETPVRNRLLVGAIHFGMSWDALLRGKVLIEEASILDIGIDTPRERPGNVLPPAPKKEDGEGAGRQVLENARREFAGNAVGDLAAIASGSSVSSQVGELAGDLKSAARVDALRKSLDEKERQWQARLAAMPKAEEFAALQKRLAAVRADGVKDAAQLQTALRELQSIRDDFESRSRTVGETGALLRSEVGATRSSFAEIDDLVKEDVRDMQARMKIPSLDAHALSRALFGLDVLARVAQARGVMEQARHYMPPKTEMTDKADRKSELNPQERERGRNYAFGRPNSYPAFWLRKAKIGTRPGAQGQGITGDILEVSTDPSMTGRPMVARIAGELPGKGASGIKAELTIDHTTATPVERLTLDVSRYAVPGRALVSSPSLELAMTNAQGAVKLSAELRDEEVDVRIGNRFTGLSLAANSGSVAVREMMAASIGGIDTIEIDARVSGRWSGLRWDLSSNLGAALSQGMRRYLQGRVDEARARIEAQVKGRIAEGRARMLAKQDEIEGKLKSLLGEREAQVASLRSDLDKVRRQLDDRKNAPISGQQQKLKEEAGKTLDKLRGKF